MTAARYYPVTVSNHAGRHGSLCWGAPCERLGDARRQGKALVEAGEATLSFVVIIGDGRRDVIGSATHPASAAKIVRHYAELLASLEAGLSVESPSQEAPAG